MNSRTRVELQEEMRQAMAHLGLRYYGALDHVSRSNGLTVNELLFKLNSAEPEFPHDLGCRCSECAIKCGASLMESEGV